MTSTSSWTTVPEPIRVLFENFPLRTLPPIPSTTPAVDRLVAEATHPFAAAKPEPTRALLGVYSVHTMEGRVLASDPLCLAQQLSFCQRNTVRMPQLTTTSQPPVSSLRVLSHRASADSVLPLLIEETVAAGSARRLVREFKTVQAFNATHLEGLDVMIAELLNTVVYDAWMVLVLFHLSPAAKIELYQREDLAVARLGIFNSMACLVKRNGFHIRHPQLASQWDETWQVQLQGTLTPQVARLKLETEKIIKQAEEAFKGLVDWLADRSDNVLTDCLLAAFVYCFGKWGDGFIDVSLLQAHQQRVFLSGW